MKKILLTAGISVFVAALLSLGVQAQQKPSVRESSVGTGLYGLPTHLRDLTDLSLLEDDVPQAAASTPIGSQEAPSLPQKSLYTAPQKSEVYLSWLAAERKTPSSVTTGLGGGPIGTNYIQAQIVKGLSADGDRLALEWVLSSKELKDEGLRDAVRLALGGMGDQSQVQDLERILLKNPNPYFRAIAVDDLGLLDSAASLPVLERALEDSYSETFASHSHGGKVVTLYPVREAAAQTVKVLGDPVMREAKRKWSQPLRDRKVDNSLYMLAHGMSAQHFVDIANGGKG